MKILTMKTSQFCLVAVAMLLSLWGGSAFAESYNLTAGTTSVTMPDGRVINMWGYGLDGGPITVPGPPLLVTDGTLNINLTNNLAEPTSIVINGQNTAMTPVWIDPNNPLGTPTATGSRTAGDFTSRVRSFTHETAPGQTVSYTWAAIRPGTYLYQSGTHPSKQVQMGLYGAVKAESVALEAYPAVVGPPALPAVTYNQDVILLFSEIDPALHDAVAPTGATAPIFGTAEYPSTIDYKPKYFLINGKSYTSDQLPLNAIAPAVPAVIGDTILLRFLNAGLESRVAVVQGQTPTLHAEDGNRLPFALQNNALLLPAGKTLDATFIPTADGYIPIFDRRLGLSNAGSAPGGMLAYLQVGAAAQTLTVTTTGIGTVKAVSAPGGINCGNTGLTTLSLCSQSYLPGSDILLSASAGAGSTFKGIAAWTGCDSLVGQDCLVTMSAAKSVNANFNLLKKIILLTPNGREPLLSGTRFTITWAVQTGSKAVTFNLAYSLDNGVTWKRIARGVTGTSYNWLVPTVAGNKNGVLVRVAGINAAGKVVGSDTSNAPFNIHTLKLTAPNGGEVLTSGTEKIITWTTGNTVKPVERVTILLTRDGGLTWTRITDTNVNTGSFPWTVPTVKALKKNCKVRIVLRGAGGVVLGADASDKVFRIQPATP